MLGSEWVSVIVTAVLAGITGFYAKRTADIAKLTKQQAEASVKMAEEMRQQRLATRPVVIPDIDIHSDDKLYGHKVRGLAQSDFPLILTNVGTAAALELGIELVIPTKESISIKLPLSLQGAQWIGKLTYVADFDAAGEPIFNQPPPEGTYELSVTFKSTSPKSNAESSKVTLPFDLHWSGRAYYWTVRRKELLLKLSE